ncbi:MAG: hypothetical protein ACFFD4_28595 [Candidatus Odinarchaeota archaeon]
MSLDKFFNQDKAKSDKKKAKESDEIPEPRDVSKKDRSQLDIPASEQATGELTNSSELSSEPNDKERPVSVKTIDEPVVTIPGLEHKWEPDWLDNVSKEELYYMLKETVEANRKFHHLKNYIEKQMILRGSLDSTEMAIRLNLTEGEILILFDSIRVTRKRMGNK